MSKIKKKSKNVTCSLIITIHLFYYYCIYAFLLSLIQSVLLD
jgi:hypothetical protein